ncbi:MAG TPA: DUF365 domain-containing protein [Methanobacterium sp.]|jgi:hypothetical protein|nr:MAG: DUF365 domain-containing protein [Methanobacterium sp.]HOI71417.1 DUF365 domain-containing protein [Methanobacterium sp.]
MKIVGVSHPIPTEIAERIYEENKNVFVGKRCLCKVGKGDKFIIYESQGAKKYTGWADIKFIGRMKPKSISKRYGKKLMITGKELKEYSKDRKDMFVIEFENFQKFSKPVKPKGYFVTIAGKYINEDEYKTIEAKKG